MVHGGMGITDASLNNATNIIVRYQQVPKYMQNKKRFITLVSIENNLSSLNSQCGFWDS